MRFVAYAIAISAHIVKEGTHKKHLMMPRLRKTLFAQEETNMPPVIDRNKCIGCGVCADVCPLQVFRHEPKKDKIPEVRRPYECWHCNACVLDCRAKAIELRLPLTHMLLYVDSDSLKPKE